MGDSGMKRDDLFFERPTDLFAGSPPEMRGCSRDDVRLMVSSTEGESHHLFTDLPRLLEPGDLLVVNESATLPASLPATGRLGNIRLNLSTRFGDNLWIAEPRWSPARPGPLPLQEQDTFQIGEARARLLRPYPGIPRLWLTQLDTPASVLMAKYGEPIHYGYAPAYPIETYQTLFSRFPGSVEMPSAARPITSRVRDALFAHGIGITRIVLHTGVSSLEIEHDTVEHQALYPESFRVPAATAHAVNAVHDRGHRVIAVGTTVLRALETAWTLNGLRACTGSTSLYVHPGVGVRAVDGLLTGLHDPVTSHLAMLSAVAGIDRVKKAYNEAIVHRYLWHEFGDSHLIWRRQGENGTGLTESFSYN
jgi:S-adenosylmethionine:tRNA ribosyltransferase-isomerase